MENVNALFEARASLPGYVERIRKQLHPECLKTDVCFSSGKLVCRFLHPQPMARWLQKKDTVLVSVARLSDLPGVMYSGVFDVCMFDRI